MFKLVCLNKWLTLRMRGLWYMNVTHIFLCVFARVLSSFCVLVILFIRLQMVCIRKPLFLAIVQMMYHSCCLA
jgi:hypothetical protein